MNKFFTFTFSVILMTLALGCTKTVKSQLVAADQAKLEEIKKALAEQAKGISTVAPPAGAPEGLSEAEKKVIVGLQVVPPSLSLLEGTSETIAVIAIQADGRRISLSEGVSFKSKHENLVTASPVSEQSRFTVKGHKPGRSSLQISYVGLEAELEVLIQAKEILAIDIFPKSTVLGSPNRFRLNVVYNNDTQSEITQGVSWEPISGDYLTGDGQSSSSGVFTGVKVGSGSMKASYLGQSIVSRIEVKMPKILTIRVDSDADTYLLGTEVKLMAIATFASGNSFDISSSVNWSSTDQGVATVSSTGEFEAIFPGETEIKASYDSIIGSETYFVTSVNFADIRIESPASVVPAGLSLNYKTWGIKADNTEVEITNYTRWSASDTSLAQSGTLDSPKVSGKFTGLAPGDLIVTARYGSMSKTVALTVSEAAVVGLAMSSANPEGDCGINQPQMLVTASLSDGNSKDITDTAIFTVAPPSAGAPHTDVSKKGLIVTTESIAAKVIASYTEVKTGVTHTAELPLSILPRRELGVGIEAPSESIAYGEVLTLSAGQIMSCGTGLDYTSSSSWLTDSNSSTMNSYINTAGTKGVLASSMLVTAPTTTPAIVKVSAIKGTSRSDLNVTIRPREVKTITVRTQVSELDVGTTAPVTLTARYSDNVSVDMLDMSLFPGFAVQFSVVDCVETGCATIDANTGLLSAGSKEGLVKIFATLSTPQGYTVIAQKFNVEIRSKCASGTRVGLYCLYQGTLGQGCDNACTAATGSYHNATEAVFGKGGLAADCDLAIKAFGFTAGLETPSYNRAIGLGCAIYEIPALSIQRGIRENVTTTTAAAFDPAFYRICACTVP